MPLIASSFLQGLPATNLIHLCLWFTHPSLSWVNLLVNHLKVAPQNFWSSESRFLKQLNDLQHKLWSSESWIGWWLEVAEMKLSLLIPGGTLVISSEKKVQTQKEPRQFFRDASADDDKGWQILQSLNHSSYCLVLLGDKSLTFSCFPLSTEQMTHSLFSAFEHQEEH